MARSVSLAAMQAALAQETAKVFLVLMEVDHADWGAPVRLVNNTENITSGGNVYTAFPFYAKMPDDLEDREPVAEITVSNVTRELIDEVRNIHSGLTVALKVVLADTPSTIEWGPIEMDVRSISYNADSVTFLLGMQAFSREPFPYPAFTPNKFPGLFKR